jgi:hypothetical protein
MFQKQLNTAGAQLEALLDTAYVGAATSEPR